LEIVAAAFNEMFLFLDDMHRAKKEDVEKCQRRQESAFRRRELAFRLG